jgi:hypothetical protein
MAAAVVVDQQVPDRAAEYLIPADELLDGNLAGEHRAEHTDRGWGIGGELAGRVQQLVARSWVWLKIRVRPNSSWRQDWIRRSMIEFIRGLRAPLSTTSRPASDRSVPNRAGYLPSRSSPAEPSGGRTKREIMRSLKRYISRRLFRTLNSANQATSSTLQI